MGLNSNDRSLMHGCSTFPTRSAPAGRCPLQSAAVARDVTKKTEASQKTAAAGAELTTTRRRIYVLTIERATAAAAAAATITFRLADHVPLGGAGSIASQECRQDGSDGRTTQSGRTWTWVGRWCSVESSEWVQSAGVDLCFHARCLHAPTSTTPLLEISIFSPLTFKTRRLRNPIACWSLADPRALRGHSCTPYSFSVNFTPPLSTSTERTRAIMQAKHDQTAYATPLNTCHVRNAVRLRSGLVYRYFSISFVCLSLYRFIL